MDMKEFWEGNTKEDIFIEDLSAKEIRNELGLFFWERGGKQFVKGFNVQSNGKVWGFKVGLIKIAKDLNNASAKDFLDCLACLGEEKVKELIKGLI